MRVTFCRITFGGGTVGGTVGGTIAAPPLTLGAALFDSRSQREGPRGLLYESAVFLLPQAEEAYASASAAVLVRGDEVEAAAVPERARVLEAVVDEGAPLACGGWEGAAGGEQRRAEQGDPTELARAARRAPLS